MVNMVEHLPKRFWMTKYKDSILLEVSCLRPVPIYCENAVVKEISMKEYIILKYVAAKGKIKN